jgi:hypothetical protein
MAARRKGRMSYQPLVILGSPDDPKLVIFQVMYQKNGRVLVTIGVWDVTVEAARERDRRHPGCPMPWRQTYVPGRDDSFLGECRARTRTRAADMEAPRGPG